MPPEPKKRGVLTALSIDNSVDVDQYIKLVKEWAENVYESFITGHNISKKIASLYREKYGF